MTQLSTKLDKNCTKTSNNVKNTVKQLFLLIINKKK